LKLHDDLLFSFFAENNAATPYPTAQIGSEKNTCVRIIEAETFCISFCAKYGANDTKNLRMLERYFLYKFGGGDFCNLPLKYRMVRPLLDES
jgi:hypothetical protein